MQIYKKSIELLKSVQIHKGESSLVIKGPQGELKLELSRILKKGWFFVRRSEFQKGDLTLLMVVHPSERADPEARLSTIMKHLQTSIIGVTSGYLSQLEIQGLGYRVSLPSAVGTANTPLRFKLGETHEQLVGLKPDLVYSASSRSGPGGEASVWVYGINKNQVFQTEASIVGLSKSGRGDVYKGKGIRPAGNRPKLKSGKRK